MEKIKNRINIEIAGTRFTVLSEETDAYTKRLASKLTDEIGVIRKAAPGLSLSSAAMLAALNYCDSSTKAQADADALRTQIKEDLAEITKQRGECDELAEENEKLRRDIETLRKRLGERGKTPEMPAPVSRTVKTVRAAVQTDEAAEEITDFFEKFEKK